MNFVDVGFDFFWGCLGLRRVLSHFIGFGMMQCDIIAIDFRFDLDADFDYATGFDFDSIFEFGFDRDHEIVWAGFDVL